MHDRKREADNHTGNGSRQTYMLNRRENGMQPDKHTADRTAGSHTYMRLKQADAHTLQEKERQADIHV